MKLFNYWRSSSSWRVRIALAHKGLEYEYVPVHLVKDGGEQRQGWFRELNAAGQVPLLELEREGKTERLGQSMAILAYLEDVYPTPAFLPEDPIAKSRAIHLAEIVNSGTQPLQNLTLIQAFKANGWDAKAWCQEAIANGLAAYEQTMQELCGEFSVGDSPSWADALLVPQLYNARRFELDLSPYPTLLKVEKNCFELDSFDSTRPEHMPDAQ